MNGINNAMNSIFTKNESKKWIQKEIVIKINKKSIAYIIIYKSWVLL